MIPLKIEGSRCREGREYGPKLLFKSSQTNDGLTLPPIQCYILNFSEWSKQCNFFVCCL